MSLLSLLGFKKCTHDKMGLYNGGGYCPDCGEYVENQWYIVRCSCCGVKRIAMTKGCEAVPQDLFCTNCGEHKYFVEKVTNINFIDINYATFVQTICTNKKQNHTQSWIDYPIETKLLCTY